MRLIVALACSLAATACVKVAVSRNAPAETIRIDGSPGVMPLAVALARAYEAEHRSVKIEMGGGLGSRPRLDSLVAGRIDIALNSMSISADELSRRGIAAHEVARVAVVFAVSSGVGVTALASAQVCDAYARRVTNWRQLGGAALPIAARTRPAGEVDGDVAVAGVPCLKEAIAAGAPMSIEKPEEMAAELQRLPGALGMTSMSFVEQSGGRLRALALNGVLPTPDAVRGRTYPLVRSAMFVTRAAIPPAVERFMAFVRSSEGARVIAANGGVAVQ